MYKRQTATYTQEGETLTAKAGITVKGAAAPTVQSYGLDSNSVTVNKGSGYSTPSATVTLSDGSTDSATVTVTGEGGFDRNTPGTYTISCSISYNLSLIHIFITFPTLQARTIAASLPEGSISPYNKSL